MEALTGTLKSLFGSGVRELRKVIPQELSSEKKLMNSVAGGLALMVMADGEIEEEETVGAIEFLLDLDCVSELGMQQDAAEMYERHVNKLETAYKNGPVKFAIAKAEVLGEISIIKSVSEAYRQSLISMLDLLTSGGGSDPSELKMKQDILAKLA